MTEVGARTTSLSPKKAKEEDGKFIYVGQALVDSGTRYYGVGQYDDALKAFTAALQAQRLTLGNSHICVAHTLSNIGAVLLKLNSLLLAQAALTEALEIKEKLQPPNLAEMTIADTLNNLGNACLMMGDLDHAMNFYNRALKEYKFGPILGSPNEIADILYNIGQVYCLKSDYADALSKFSEAVDIIVKAHGRDQAIIAEIIERIGAINLYLQRYDDAMEDFEESLRVNRLLLGSHHENIAPSLYNIGLVYEAQGQTKTAIQTYKDALAVYDRNNIDNDSVKIIRKRIKDLQKTGIVLKIPAAARTREPVDP